MPLDTNHLFRSATDSINSNKIISNVFTNNVILAIVMTMIIIVIIGTLYDWKGNFVKLFIFISITCFGMITIHDSLYKLKLEEEVVTRSSTDMISDIHDNDPVGRTAKQLLDVQLPVGRGPQTQQVAMQPIMQPVMQPMMQPVAMQPMMQPVAMQPMQSMQVT